jgi:NADH pyrophosphatase NudC (nudix superfamily)
MNDMLPVLTLIESLERAGRTLGDSEAVAEVLAGVAEPPELVDEEPLRQLIHDLEAGQATGMKLQESCASLDGLALPPTPMDTSALSGLITQMQDLETRLAGQLADEVAEAGEALSATIRNIRKWARKNRVCPTCGVELDPERIERFVASGAGKHQHG